jgi:hypothetical protein
MWPLMEEVLGLKGQSEVRMLHLPLLITSWAML